MATSTRIRFPGFDVDEGADASGTFDLGEAAALLDAVDATYIAAFRIASPTFRRSAFGRFPRPTVRVADGSLVVDLLHDARDISVAISVTVTALAAASAAVRREKRGRLEDRRTRRRYARDEEVEEAEHELRMRVLRQQLEVNRNDLRVLAERASKAVAVGGAPEISQTNDGTEGTSNEPN